MPEPEELDWQGLTLIDADGQEAGTIAELFLDPSAARPAWAQVDVDAGQVLVPLLDARHEGDTVRVSVGRELVQSAPSHIAGDALTPENEQELYEHYGISEADLRDHHGSPHNLPEG